MTEKTIKKLITWEIFVEIVNDVCKEVNGERAADAFVSLQSINVEPVHIAFPTMLRKMWSGGEVQNWLNELPPLYSTPQTEETLSLKVRIAELEEELAASKAKGCCGVPDGYKLVPIEPTEPMLDKAENASFVFINHANARLTYKAMISAALTNPERIDGPGKFTQVQTDYVKPQWGNLPNLAEMDSK